MAKTWKEFSDRHEAYKIRALTVATLLFGQANPSITSKIGCISFETKLNAPEFIEALAQALELADQLEIAKPLTSPP